MKIVCEIDDNLFPKTGIFDILNVFNLDFKFFFSKWLIKSKHSKKSGRLYLKIKNKNNNRFSHIDNEKFQIGNEVIKMENISFYIFL